MKSDVWAETEPWGGQVFTEWKFQVISINNDSYWIIIQDQSLSWRSWAKSPFGRAMRHIFSTLHHPLKRNRGIFFQMICIPLLPSSKERFYYSSKLEIHYFILELVQEHSFNIWRRTIAGGFGCNWKRKALQLIGRFLLKW